MNNMHIFEHVVGIIPARMNSKRLKNKNFLNLSGKPLYSYSTNLASKLFPISYFTTDNQSISQIDLPSNVTYHLRDSSLSHDNTEMRSVISDIINSYSIINSHIILLQPTSPLRDERDIINSYKLFTKNECSQVISVCKTSNSILKYGFCENNIFRPISSTNYLNMNDQSLPTVYRPNGSIYIFSAKSFVENNYNFPNSKILGYRMKENNSIDINTFEDFSAAEGFISS